jgi:hypothetical protein
VQVLVLVLASELPAFASESWKAWCNWWSFLVFMLLLIMDQAEYIISTIYNFRTTLKMKELGGLRTMSERTNVSWGAFWACPAPGWLGEVSLQSLLGWRSFWIWMSILDNHKKYQKMTSSNLSVATFQSPEICVPGVWRMTLDVREPKQTLVECAGSVHELFMNSGPF